MEQTSGSPSERPRLVLGTMTGTSIDGDLDVALVEIHGRGLSMRARFVEGLSRPLGPLADDLRRIARQEPLSAGDFARIARAFGEAHADALEALCLATRRRPELAVLHGQTVFHAPPHTWQLIDPWPVATRLRCRVRYDLRGANVASGGQGAPITPLADVVLFGCGEGLIVLNLGGFINATFVPPRGTDVGEVRGFDVCVCNHLLDRVARERLGTAFDPDGSAAHSGIGDAAIARRISHAIAPPEGFGAPRRSLGTGDEAARLVDLTSGLEARNACRTVVDAIADATSRVLAAEIPGKAGVILAAGGSARNAALMKALAWKTGCVVRSTEDSDGVPVQMREPAEIAILGALADDGVRYALPQVTGAASLAPDSAVIEAG